MNETVDTPQATQTEMAKGYWTDNSIGYLDVAVTMCTTENEQPKTISSTILLSSNYWYRVQRFTLNDDTAWMWVRALLRECGRTLPEPQSSGGYIYRISNLSLQQANQMYYLLKHSLTSAKIIFTLSHSLTFDANTTVAPPKQKKNRRLRRKGNRGLQSTDTSVGELEWKIVGVHKLN